MNTWISRVLVGLAFGVSNAAMLSACATMPKPEKPKVEKPKMIHPQDGLTAQEIQSIKAILLKSGAAKKDSLYPLFEFIEPAKSAVYAWKKGAKLPARRAMVHLRRGDKFYVAVVNLTKQKLESIEAAKGQPMILLEEFETASNLVKTHPKFIKSLAKRGFKPDDVYCMPLTAGSFRAEDDNKRLLKVPCGALPKGANFHARPIEGLYGLVDLEKKKVLELVDTGVVSVPTDEWNYTEEAVAKRFKLRKKTNPAVLTQKGGPNFAINNHKISWDIWDFHYRVDKRPGLVISDVRVNDGEKMRQVMYQMHLSEVFVPYMDPARTWNYRTYMDSGEYGFGLFLSPLRSGIDCPAHATYLPAVINDDMGNPFEIPDAICVFERNIGDPAWRHFEIFSQGPNTFTPAEGRPETELVVRTASEVGNYDYLVDYRFKQNGDIYIKIGASGLDATKGADAISTKSKSYLKDTRFGTLIAPNLVAPNHDHYFNFRLDMDIDTPNNTAMLTEILPYKATSPTNPRGTMWYAKNSPIKSEKHGSFRFTATKPKHLMVMNMNKSGHLGHHPSYMLHHGSVAYGPYDFEADQSMKRNAYIKNSVWNTLYDPKQRYAGGEFALGSSGKDTLAEWVKADRNLLNKDVVTWFTAGFHHIPRTEDWPVMSTEWATIHLQPMNFFPHNPALTIRDVKPEKK